MYTSVQQDVNALSADGLLRALAAAGITGKLAQVTYKLQSMLRRLLQL